MKDLFFFILFGVLLLVGLYGAQLPNQHPTIHLGNWQLSTFKSGLAFYQQDQPNFYTISPLNDFYVTQDNQRVALLSGTDFDENNYQTNLDQPQLDKIILGFKNYFLSQPIEYKFSHQHQANYLASPQNEWLQISKHNQISEPQPIISLGTTLNFFPEDFIFTLEGNLMSSPSAKQVDLFTQQYSFPLTLSSKARQQVTEGKIILYSPQLTNFLLIETPSQSHLWVDNQNHLIEIYYPVNQPQTEYQTQFQIKNLKSIQDLKKI